MIAQGFTEKETEAEILPFPYTLHLVVSSDIIYSASIRKEFIGTVRIKDNGIAFTWSQAGHGHVWVFLPEDTTVGDIAHEMLHVVAFVMEDIGAGFEEEVWAYHLDELVQGAYDFVNNVDTASEL